MTFQPGANLYTQGFGSRPENVEVPHYDVRAPSTSDILYPIGKVWVYRGQSIWQLLNISASQGLTTATWVQLADSDGAVQAILGTASQITVTNNAGTATISLPSSIVTPGSLATTTTLTAGTGLTVTAGGAAITGTTTINTSGSAVTTIGTGGTGATNIGNATGNTAVTGSLTASTSLTATLGAITATNGNLVLGTAGNKLMIAAGANGSVGTSGALSTGTVNVATTAVTASSKIFLTRAVSGGTLGNLSVGTITPATGFDITSDNAADTSTVNWLIIN